MAAKMLCAYYDKSCDSRALFAGLKVEQDKSFETFLNKYYVIYVDMTDFTTKYRGDKEIVKRIQDGIMNDVLEAFPDVKVKERDDLMDILYRISERTGERFVNIVFAGAYLTGILPIKKYNTESALNNFNEYSMIDPACLASCYGFTEEEVQTLAQRHHASMENLKMWYDGYTIGREKSIYNPYSVMKSLPKLLDNHRCLRLGHHLHSDEFRWAEG